MSLYVIGSDHAGLALKGVVVSFLQERNISVLDVGPSDSTSVDYPDFALKVCEKLLESSEYRGILICGSGIGMSIAANKFSHIRAALCTDAYMAKMARAHNDANVLCLGERISGVGEVESILEAFINGAFEGGRHLRRVEKLGKLGK